MIQQRITVTNQSGLHARPAALLVQTTTKHKSEVKILKGDTEVNAKSMIGIMGLGVKQGDEITFLIEGPDEKDTLVSIEDLFKSNFGE